MSQRRKLGKATSPFTLNMYTTSLPNVDGQLPAMPLNFELPMKARTKHTGQAMITIQKGIDGPEKLGASPGASDSAMGRLSAG